MSTCYIWQFLLFYFSQSAIQVMNWPDKWQPRYVSSYGENKPSHEFLSYDSENDIIKLLLVEDDKAFIGGSNHLYYISLDNLEIITVLEWNPRKEALALCVDREMPQCDNYIRVVLRQADKTLLVCGTNAYNPKCRQYEMSTSGNFKMIGSEEDGRERCPYTAVDNSTVTNADEVVYSATYTDEEQFIPAITKWVNISYQITTRISDPLALNSPQFIASFQMDEHVYFIFRERAIEDVQGGHVMYSRVARVCTGDRGDPYGSKTFTSYFKARINCAINGSSKFHFNEIQSMSDMGIGSFSDVGVGESTNQVFYSVFNTPVNSIWGSAVCAYKFKDVQNVFDKEFKGQILDNHVWESVAPEDVPRPNLTKCEIGNKTLDVNTLIFIYKHPLMDASVETLTETPLLVYSYVRSRLTHIAVDWRVLAVDQNNYDILFLGTTDGRVIKTFNAGTQTRIQTVVIEDLQVFPISVAVVNLRIVRNPVAKLVVASSYKVVVIPLYRCGTARTCSACVALRDPYCSWNIMNDACDSKGQGLQDVAQGFHTSCGTNETIHPPYKSQLNVGVDETTFYLNVISAVMTGTGVVIAVGVLVIIALQWSVRNEDVSMSDLTEMGKETMRKMGENENPRPIVVKVSPSGSTWL